jgi:hypothetical protein
MAHSAFRTCAPAVIWPLAWGLLIIGLVCWGLRAHTAPTETSLAAHILGFFIWFGAAALCALTLKGLSWTHHFWMALVAMRCPLALVFIGAFLLFLNDQGRELGVSLMIGDAGWFHLVFLFAMLFLALLYWSLNSWLSARLGVRASSRQIVCQRSRMRASSAEKSGGFSGCHDCLASARISSRPST